MKDPRTARLVLIFKEDEMDPRTADLVQILKVESKNSRTADLVGIFEGGWRIHGTSVWSKFLRGWRDPWTAESVGILKRGYKDPQAAESVQI